MDQETDTSLPLQPQTEALGQMLKSVSESDPSGTPTPAATSAFVSWVTEAGPASRQPDYFLDVLENYDIPGNSNRDLYDMFHILEAYLPVVDEAWEDEVSKTFIGLPLL
jgi:hypothetical protein